ncbi:MAG TPA: hypothetical protein DEQ43_02390 [Nocardioides bacterium]|nr:hypothetical protein [Nocardioides sp.]
METTQLPLWLVVVLTVVPALIAGTTALGCAWLSGARKASGELDRWRRREETMRMLRWAADKGTAIDTDGRLVALSVLDALDRSKPVMLQPEDQGILDAVIDAVLADPTADVARYPGINDSYEVEVIDDG